MTLSETDRLTWLYGRKLEEWARGVADQRQAFFDALRTMGERVKRERLVAAGEWEFDRWFTQAHLLLVCVRNVWRFAKAYQQVAGDDESAKHFAAFEGMVAPAKDFRDFIEHFDEYARGEGKIQHKLPRPDELGSMAMDAGGFPTIEYHFGGRSMNVDNAATAAVGLAQMLLGIVIVRPEMRTPEMQGAFSYTDVWRERYRETPPDPGAA